MDFATDSRLLPPVGEPRRGRPAGLLTETLVPQTPQPSKINAGRRCEVSQAGPRRWGCSQEDDPCRAASPGGPPAAPRDPSCLATVPPKCFILHNILLWQGREGEGKQAAFPGAFCIMYSAGPGTPQAPGRVSEPSSFLIYSWQCSMVL